MNLAYCDKIADSIVRKNALLKYDPDNIIFTFILFIYSFYISICKDLDKKAFISTKIKDY